MRLEFEGWLRHLIDHTLINTEISKLRPDDDEGCPIHGARIVGPTILGELIIRASAEKLNLHGDYKVEIRLTKAEIANLARIAFENDSFADVLDALSQTAEDRPSQ